jgi:hypothetical protein
MVRGTPSMAAFRVAVSLLAVVALVVAPVSAGTADRASVTGSSGHANSCFPADGTAFVVGTEGPQLRFTLHLSLLPAVLTATNGSEVGAAGAFGIEATATTTDASPVVSLRTGVLFTGVESAAAFLANPFEPFALAFDYRLLIPAFAGTTADSAYEESDVPVSGPVEEAACSA